MVRPADVAILHIGSVLQLSQAQILSQDCMLSSHAYGVLQDLSQACNLFFAAMPSVASIPKHTWTVLAN